MAKETPITACTIGHFDGVHLGHQHLIKRLRECAKERGIERVIVVTFDRLPRSLFDPSFHPKMLTTFDERKALLAEYGVDDCYILTFDRQMASMTARDFMKKMLFDKFGVRFLLLGYDNRFGKRIEGEGLDDYIRYGKEIGIEVMECDEYVHTDGSHVSSSVIRELLENNNTEKAQELLGH